MSRERSGEKNGNPATLYRTHNDLLTAPKMSNVDTCSQVEPNPGTDDKTHNEGRIDRAALGDLYTDTN